MTPSEHKLRSALPIGIFRTRLRASDIALLALALGLFVILSIRSAPALALRLRGTNSDSTIANRVQMAEAALYSGVPTFAPKSDSFLVRALDSYHSESDRFTAMTALAARPDSVPFLKKALNSPDPSVRLAATQLLGWQRASAAIDALIGATFDSRVEIRESAITALGEIGSLRALPRIHQVQIVQTNFYVQEAAYVAEQKIMSGTAAELGIGTPELHAVAVAPLTGWAYAVTSQGLFARQDAGWEHQNDLPGQLMDVIATDARGRTVFAGTRAGLYRSLDGGKTWLAVPLPAHTLAHATAVLVDPQNSQQIYVALATPSPSRLLPATGLGVYSSDDGGNNWMFLPDSPSDYVTTRLALDSSFPQYLFGATGVGTWRYTLTDGASGTRAD